MMYDISTGFFTIHTKLDFTISTFSLTCLRPTQIFSLPTLNDSI